MVITAGLLKSFSIFSTCNSFSSERVFLFPHTNWNMRQKARKNNSFSTITITIRFNCSSSSPQSTNYRIYKRRERLRSLGDKKICKYLSAKGFYKALQDHCAGRFRSPALNAKVDSYPCRKYELYLKEFHPWIQGDRNCMLLQLIPIKQNIFSGCSFFLNHQVGNFKVPAPAITYLHCSSMLILSRTWN